ncbi:MAG: glycosyltransferase family 2 protein [Sulfolobus sp.]|nr:glycosyltransferase family 2 protein [Sulfolobus sp.]
MNFILEIFINALIFILPLIYILYHLILYKFGSSVSFLKDLTLENYPYISIIVPIKNEPLELLQGLLNNLSELLWDKNKLEVIIVSDDTDDYFNYIKNNIVIPEGLNVKLLERTNKLGFKSGALTYGFFNSTGELILTLDVDARLKKDELLKAYKKMISDGCDAVTMKWIGYYRSPKSKVAKALTVLTLFTSESIQKGRERLGFQVFPVGCGTLFKRNVIEEVGPWDYRIIQDDLEIGARLLAFNKKVCASDSTVSVIVPEDFFSYYIQQTRWAMGESEVLRNRFKEIFYSKQKLLEKIEAFFFLTQYLPISTTFLGTILLVVLAAFKQSFNLNLIAFLSWLIMNILYSYEYIRLSYRLGYTTKESLMSLGRLSAYTEALSPFIFYNMVVGLLKIGNKTYNVTPKSKKLKNKKIILIIFLFGVLFLTGSMLSYIYKDYLSSFWLLTYSSGFLYTSLMYKKEL